MNITIQNKVKYHFKNRPSSLIKIHVKRVKNVGSKENERQILTEGQNKNTLYEEEFNQVVLSLKKAP